MKDSAEYEKASRIAHEAARSAAAVHRAHLGRVNTDDWSSKGTADFVSYVDREAEAEALRHIRQAFPGHEILAEESADDSSGVPPTTAEWVWIVDPLDGTTNYSHGYPCFCVSIAIERAGRIEIGVVYDPMRDEVFAAVGAGQRCGLHGVVRANCS